MKTCFHAFLMCRSMFCALPASQLWDEKARDKMLPFLPLVGLEIGALWAGLAWLCRYFSAPNFLTALLLCGWPYFATGFIHLDGFMDVTDAVRSYRSPERRREILKDSHVGSFAVIAVIFLILNAFACFFGTDNEENLLILLLIPAVSRCGSALAVTVLKPMSTSQYADRERKSGHIVAVLTMLTAFLAAGFLLCGKFGFCLVGCLIGYGLALGRGYKSLQGMNGDIAGYALSIGEVCAVAVYALI